MRSRFWLGGVNAEPRRGGTVGAAAIKALQRVRGPDATLAEALVVHCSQEMSHLASLLPALYAELGNDWAFGRTPPRTSFQFALREAAADYGVATASFYDEFNGPDHDEDPREKGYISVDGFHASTESVAVQVEVLHDVGYDTIIP